MTRSLAFRIAWMGLVTWAIPFLVSVLIYGRDGQLQIPVGTFKAIMFVCGTATAMALLVLLYRSGAPLRRAGLVVGAAWLAINLALDLIVLVGGFGMALGTYFATVAPAYLTIPIVTVGVDRIAGASRRP